MDKEIYIQMIKKMRVPVSCTIEITSRCGFACPYCYLDNKCVEIPGSRVIQLIDEAVELGCKNLTLTGGDAFLHKDFDTIYMHAYSRGLRITVFSNAYSIQDSTFDILKEYKPNKVECTIYGASIDTYFQVTKREDSYHKVWENLERLKSLGITVVLKTFLTKINYDERISIVNIVRKWNDGEVKSDYNIMPRRRHDWSLVKKYQLSDKEIVDMQCELDEQKVEEWKGALTADQKKWSKIFGCGAGNYSYCILVNEDMQICHFAYFSAVSLKNRTIRSVWDEFISYSRMNSTEQECKNSCNLSGLCEKCAVQCYLHNYKPNSEQNNVILEGRVHRACRLAEERYQRCLQIRE